MSAARLAIRAGALPVVASLLAACVRLPPPDSDPAGDRGGRTARGSAAVAPDTSEAARLEAERLKELGPVYTRFDSGPRIVWDEATQRALTETIAPVLQAQRLPLATSALLWLLVGADGRVYDGVVQTSAGNAAFDAAAAEAGKSFRFLPATSGGRPVAVWVIREISLLMQ